jgi:hypothetical protein
VSDTKEVIKLSDHEGLLCLEISPEDPDLSLASELRVTQFDALGVGETNKFTVNLQVGSVLFCLFVAFEGEEVGARALGDPGGEPSEHAFHGHADAGAEADDFQFAVAGGG